MNQAWTQPQKREKLPLQAYYTQQNEEMEELLEHTGLKTDEKDIDLEDFDEVNDGFLDEDRFNQLQSLKPQQKVIINDSFLSDLDIVMTNDERSVATTIQKFFLLKQTKTYFLNSLKQPISNLQILQQRYNDIWYTKVQLSSQKHQLIKSIKRYSSFYPILSSLRKYTMDSVVYLKFQKSLQSIIEVIDQLSFIRFPQQNQRIPDFIQRINQTSDLIVSQILSSISNCLNLTAKIVSIKPGVNRDLDQLIATSVNSQEILQNKLAEYLDSFDLPPDSFSISLVKFAVQGYLLKVQVLDSKEETNLIDLLRSYGWEMIQNLETCIYFSNQLTDHLNDSTLNVQENIQIQSQKIIIEFCNQILRQSEHLLLFESHITQLDYNIGLVNLLEEYELTIPEYSQEQQIVIKKGKHFFNQGFINNDFATNRRISIITGPNYSGKSVQLKSVGIIVYLAHVGIPVPAQYAKICLFQSILSLFASREGRTRQTNSDLKNLSFVTQNMGPEAFILIDELGKNFKYDIGSALFSSTITLLKDSVVLAATHYHSVLEQDFRDQDWLQLLQMSVSVCDRNINFHYKIKPNAAESSLALEVAYHILGDEIIYARSRQLFENLTDRLQINQLKV